MTGGKEEGASATVPSEGHMERIALDILGPLPETDDGNMYILIVGDYFTKFVEAYARPASPAPRHCSACKTSLELLEVDQHDICIVSCSYTSEKSLLDQTGRANGGWPLRGKRKKRLAVKSAKTGKLSQKAAGKGKTVTGEGRVERKKVCLTEGLWCWTR